MSLCCICNKEIPKERLDRNYLTCSRSCQIKKTKREHSLDPTFRAQYRQKLSIARKRYLSTPEGLKQHKEIVTKSWQSIETQEKHRNAQKAFWANMTNDEYVEQCDKISNGMSIWYDALTEEQYVEFCVKQKRISNKYWSNISDEDRQKIKQKISKSLAIVNALEKTHINRSKSSKAACQKRKDSGYYETDEWKKISKIQKQKEFATKKANGSFNTSKIAEHCKQLLRDAGFKVDVDNCEVPYPTAKHLHCDVKLDELDLWIEFHYCHFHGPKPYHEPYNENNIEHLAAVEFLYKKFEETPKNSKGTNQYGRMLYTWTDLDVRKRQCAKDNNLNWIAFYTYEEFLQWLKENK